MTSGYVIGAFRDVRFLMVCTIDIPTLVLCHSAFTFFQDYFGFRRCNISHYLYMELNSYLREKWLCYWCVSRSEIFNGLYNRYSYFSTLSLRDLLYVLVGNFFSSFWIYQIYHFFISNSIQ